MNEGTLAVLIQWCFLCLVWMGLYDRELTRWGMSRPSALAVVAAFLVCSFVSWKLSFLPSVQVYISGFLLPFLCAGWLYSRIPGRRKRLYLVIGGCMGTLLFWFRWLLFTDPILAFWDVRWMLPACAFFAALTVSRSALIQLFLLLFALPISDLLYTVYEWRLAGFGQIGNEYAQDLLWSALSLSAVCAAVLTLIRRLFRLKDPEASRTDQNQ